MMKNQKLVIVGAGLVGSLWAVLLKKRGFDVTIFEKRSDIRKSEHTGARSINLVITSRGLKGLEAAGLLDEATKLSVPIFGRMIHSKTGELAYQPYGTQNECNFSISRANLNKFLITAAEKAGVQVHFEHDLLDINFESKTLKFQNTEVKYDVLFGTDGAGSQVRLALTKQFSQEFKSETEWLDADYKELFMPAGSELKQNALHIWPRGSHMMMGLANLDGSFTMTIYMPKNKFAKTQDEAQVKNLFTEEFNDAVNLMPKYLEEFVNNPQGRLGTVKCSKWIYKDSVALMGDAAHAIVPFFGQGMNSGFEDCVVLNQLLESKNTWNDILTNFEKIQKPNATAIAEMAVENWFEMRDKVGDAKFLLRKKIESLLEQKFPQKYKSRYGLVTYTLNSYANAQRVGLLQDKILNELGQGIQSPDQVSLDRAEKLIDGELSNFIKSEGLDLSTDALVASARNKF